ncbi:protein jag [Patescibacteria group bacterium]
MNDNITKIKDLIDEILLKLTVDASVDLVETADGPHFIIRTLEGGLLIGENGKTLISFIHLVKRIAEKKLKGDNGGDSFFFSLDVNDYQSKKIEDLKNIAKVNAQRVRYFKKEVVLKPMTSFERRIIHMTLADCPDIITDSRGGEPARQVAIKPLDF